MINSAQGSTLFDPQLVQNLSVQPRYVDPNGAITLTNKGSMLSGISQEMQPPQHPIAINQTAVKRRQQTQHLMNIVTGNGATSTKNLART